MNERTDKAVQGSVKERVHPRPDQCDHEPVVYACEHEFTYWGGIGATCKKCGRVEIDGVRYVEVEPGKWEEKP
jgi:hypothetical protein